MTFSATHHFDDFGEEFEDAARFEKFRHNHEGVMPVASSIAACRAAHRRKSRRSRNRGSQRWQRVGL